MDDRYLAIYQAYKIGMTALLRSCDPVMPTDENLQILFPHLMTDEAKEHLEQRRFIATPPLMIKGTYHVLGCHSDDDPRLSYHGCFLKKGHDAGNILFAKRAADYSRIHFADKYLAGDFQFVLNVILRKLGARSNGLKAVWLLIDQDPAVVIGDTAAHRRQLIEASLVYKTTNPLRGREAAALHEMKVVYHCAHCGKPLRSQGCRICSNKEIDCYPDFQIGPLPETVIKWIESKGHKFTRDLCLTLEKDEHRLLPEKEVPAGC